MASCGRADPPVAPLARLLVWGLAGDQSDNIRRFRKGGLKCGPRRIPAESQKIIGAVKQMGGCRKASEVAVGARSWSVIS